jgi:hypothetical protein
LLRDALSRYLEIYGFSAICIGMCGDWKDDIVMIKHPPISNVSFSDYLSWEILSWMGAWWE